jgi:hypothetical protein
MTNEPENVPERHISRQPFSSTSSTEAASLGPTSVSSEPDVRSTASDTSNTGDPEDESSSDDSSESGEWYASDDDTYPDDGDDDADPYTNSFQYVGGFGFDGLSWRDIEARHAEQNAEVLDWEFMPNNIAAREHTIEDSWHIRRNEEAFRYAAGNTMAKRLDGADTSGN